MGEKLATKAQEVRTEDKKNKKLRSVVTMQINKAPEEQTNGLQLTEQQEVKSVSSVISPKSERSVSTRPRMASILSCQSTVEGQNEWLHHLRSLAAAKDEPSSETDSYCSVSMQTCEHDRPLDEQSEESKPCLKIELSEPVSSVHSKICNAETQQVIPTEFIVDEDCKKDNDLGFKIVPYVDLQPSDNSQPPLGSLQNKEQEVFEQVTIESSQTENAEQNPSPGEAIQQSEKSQMESESHKMLHQHFRDPDNFPEITVYDPQEVEEKEENAEYNFFCKEQTVEERKQPEISCHDKDFVSDKFSLDADNYSETRGYFHISLSSLILEDLESTSSQNKLHEVPELASSESDDEENAEQYPSPTGAKPEPDEGQSNPASPNKMQHRYFHDPDNIPELTVYDLQEFEDSKEDSSENAIHGIETSAPIEKAIKEATTQQQMHETCLVDNCSETGEDFGISLSSQPDVDCSQTVRLHTVSRPSIETAEESVSLVASVGSHATRNLGLIAGGNFGGYNIVLEDDNSDTYSDTDTLTSDEFELEERCESASPCDETEYEHNHPEISRYSLDDTTEPIFGVSQVNITESDEALQEDLKHEKFDEPAQVMTITSDSDTDAILNLTQEDNAKQSVDCSQTSEFNTESHPSAAPVEETVSLLASLGSQSTSTLGLITGGYYGPHRIVLMDDDSDTDSDRCLTSDEFESEERCESASLPCDKTEYEYNHLEIPRYSKDCLVDTTEPILGVDHVNITESDDTLQDDLKHEKLLQQPNIEPAQVMTIDSDSTDTDTTLKPTQEDNAKQSVVCSQTSEFNTEPHTSAETVDETVPLVASLGSQSTSTLSLIAGDYNGGHRIVLVDYEHLEERTDQLSDSEDQHQDDAETVLQDQPEASEDGFSRTAVESHHESSEEKTTVCTAQEVSANKSTVKTKEKGVNTDEIRMCTRAISTKKIIQKNLGINTDAVMREDRAVDTQSELEEAYMERYIQAVSFIFEFFIISV